DFRRGHLAVIVVIEITMNAPFVASIGQVDLNAERNVKPQRLRGYLFEKAAHRGSPGGEFRCGIGCSETCRISWLASSRARVSASCSASARSTSNSGQMRRSTISSSGVAPSADCHRIVAVLFK